MSYSIRKINPIELAEYRRCRSFLDMKYRRKQNSNCQRWRSRTKKRDPDYFRKWRKSQRRRQKKAGILSKINRESNLKRFGLTLKTFKELCSQQKEKCKICGIKTKLNVDHCHFTNKVRGLLCTKCNFGLGHFNDSVILLKKAIRYLS